ncbi:MAG: histidine phosphatase family protein [Lachnospiraceae bacterium]
MRLLLVRHGETDWNKMGKIQGSTDTDLNQAGRMQSKELGIRLNGDEFSIRKVFTSPQKRAAQTAEIIAEIIGKDCEIVPGLEELNLGVFEGLNWDEVKQQHPVSYSLFKQDRRHAKIPQGESYQLMLDRVIPALKYIIEQDQDESLIVTHSAVIRAILTYIADIAFEEMMQFQVGNTSVTEVDSSELKL